ncbi:MAG: hypothetical protein JSW11_13530 [Candidatus Heimdallarchaeota archaeon]|nr:MAG: hypothetical protein JSW11_13530 [Candidatus Heimdallarchaeota archaeon]
MIDITCQDLGSGIKKKIGDEKKMLYLVYWELNEEISSADIARTGIKLNELEEIEGAEVVSWIVTPDNWGISLLKVESVEAAFKTVARWRIALPGLFKCWKGALAMEVEQAIPLAVSEAELIEKL